MRYNLASNEQLNHIFNKEKDCPTHILSGVVTEMMNRNLLNGYILYAAESVNIQMMDRDDIIQTGLIELHECAQKFNPGKSAPKTFAHWCLQNRFKMIIEKNSAFKRASNLNRIMGDEIDQYIIPSPLNVENHVITKLEIEQCLSCLPEKERNALIMYGNGYTYQEIAEHYNYKDRTSTLQLIKKARKIIRKELDNENKVHHKQIS